MKPIYLLSEKTARSISLGQVVTSVFSVVKELLENALDAGASSVDVRLDDFGLDKIEVRDNGSGVTPENALLMGQAHYTSKIQNLDDLKTLSSFGFRGEALAAVCASCQVTVATRTADECVGRLLTLDADGRVIRQMPVARTAGTTVAAAQLFGRQPVRRQLYRCARRRREQLRAVETLLVATAVSRPGLRLALHHNGSQLIGKAACDSMKSAAVQVLKCEVARLLQPLVLSSQQVELEALLPPAEASVKVSGRSSSDQCYVIVNGRVVTHKPVEKLLSRVYSARHGLSPARHPVCVVRIVVAEDQLDVNLEPNKTAVRFMCERELLELLEGSLNEFYSVESSATSFAVAQSKSEEFLSESDINALVDSSPADTSAGEFVNQEPSSTPSVEHSCFPEVSDCGTRPVPVVSGEAAPVVSLSRPSAADSADLRPGTELTDTPPTAIAANISDESMFDQNFLGVSVGGGDAAAEFEGFEPTPTGLDTACEGVERMPGDSGRGREQQPVSAADSWASGALADSQGAPIQPTSLVTSYSGCQISDWARKPIAAAAPSTSAKITMTTVGTGGCTSAAETALAGRAGPHPVTPSPTNQPSIRLWTTPTKAEQAPGHQTSLTNPMEKMEESKRHMGTAKNPVSVAGRPPPAKKMRQDAGEHEYEPVASQVVRKASNAFSFYCRDMRRKYLSLDPTMPLGEMSAALADGWRAALPAVRRDYERRAREDQLRYQQDVRKAQLCETVAPPPRTVTAGTNVMTQLRRMVAPLTPEAGRARRRTRCSAALSVGGLSQQVATLESALTRPWNGAAVDLRVLGPLQSHQAWVVRQSDELLLVNPLRLCEMTTFSRLLATYQFPWRPLPEPLVITAATIGTHAYSNLLKLTRDGARVVDERVTANGFRIEVSGDNVLVTGLADCINLYGVKDLTELLQKMAADPAAPLARCRPPRTISWLQAEAVRVSQGDGARMSAEEVLTLVTSAGDLAGHCFHQRPMAAPLYRLAAT